MTERESLFASADASFARMHDGETKQHPEPLIGTLIVRTERVAYICDIVSGEPGKGHVSRYLDALKDEYDVVVCANVINPILAQALARHGFQQEVHFAPAPFEEHVRAWVWRKT